MDNKQCGKGNCNDCSIPNYFDNGCSIKEKIEEFADTIINECNELIEVSLSSDKQKTKKQQHTAMVQRETLAVCVAIITDKLEELYNINKTIETPTYMRVNGEFLHK